MEPCPCGCGGVGGHRLRRNQGTVCPCGCGGRDGHVLSASRQPERCRSLTVNGDHVFVQCDRPSVHSELVPHGNGGLRW